MSTLLLTKDDGFTHVELVQRTVDKRASKDLGGNVGGRLVPTPPALGPQEAAKLLQDCASLAELVSCLHDDGKQS